MWPWDTAATTRAANFDDSEDKRVLLAGSLGHVPARPAEFQDRGDLFHWRGTTRDPPRATHSYRVFLSNGLGISWRPYEHVGLFVAQGIEIGKSGSDFDSRTDQRSVGHISAGSASYGLLAVPLIAM